MLRGAHRLEVKTGKIVHFPGRKIKIIWKLKLFAGHSNRLEEMESSEF